MGRWFRKGATHDSAPSVEVVKAQPELAPATAGEPVRMTGTTTFGADAVTELYASHGMTDGGVLELRGWLVPEPENPADPHAVAVHVEGARIGYLPGFVAAQVDTALGQPEPCQVQLWGALDRERLRAIGWAAYGIGPVTWPHTPGSPPAITIAEETAQRVAATTRMVDDALTGNNPIRSAEFQRGMVGGYHFLETVEPIKQLKREGRLDEALALCYGAIEGAERERGGRAPAPWYTEQAAIIHRKRGERDEEIAVLRRWMRLCPPQHRAGSDIQKRLDKLLASGHQLPAGNTH